MDARTRKLVRDTLKTAHEAAFGALQAELEQLPPEGRQAVEASIEAFTSCVHHQCEGTLGPQAATERIAALVYGHAAPRCVQVMEQYARTLNDLLSASRDRLVSPHRHRGH